jgi:hypothetical protein
MSNSDDTEFEGTMLSGIPLAARPENAKKVPPRKEGWPDWPFFWMDERNMESLREIASRLKDKMEEHRRSGIIGELTPVERQMYEILSGVQQQVFQLHDAFQASLQIIDDNRPSVRLKRVLRRMTETKQRIIVTIRNSTALTVLGALSTLAFIVSGVLYLIHHFHR